MRLAASQLRISQLAGSLILWTRAWTTLPSDVLYGGVITSHSPLSSERRSPTRSSIGRILVSPAACGSCFLEERGLAMPGSMSWVNSVLQSRQPKVPNNSYVLLHANSILGGIFIDLSFSAPPTPPAASRATAAAPIRCPSRSSAECSTRGRLVYARRAWRVTSTLS